MRWNEAGRWVWSDTIAHEPLITADDFQAAQAIMADGGRARRASREAHQRVMHPYVLRGRLYCGYCGRRMQGQYSNRSPYYRCRYPREYVLASHVSHPGNVYLREADVLPAIDRWLLAIFAPRRLEQTIRQMQAAQTHLPLCCRCPARTPTPSSRASTSGSPATRPPSTPEPTPKASRSGPARSRPSAKPCSAAPPVGTTTSPLAGSPRTTSAPSSPASATCATSSATPSQR
jgi:hypothetical protein